MIYQKINSRLQWKKQMLRITKKVSSLSIEKAGFSFDDVSYVKLEKGPIFYGPQTPPRYIKYYNSLPKNIRKKLPEKCFRISMDIVIRYQEGGLKLGGPKKERQYTVNEGNVVVEMGAYRGYYTLYLAGKVGCTGRVIAIEPIPENSKFLRRNIKENALSNVSIVQKGVWNESGQITFYMNKDDMQSASITLADSKKKKIEIEVDTLDNILDETNLNLVDFMIIQLNGAEYKAIEGLTKINPKNLAIAARYTKSEETSVSQIADILKKRGYEISTAEKKFIFGKKI